MRLKLILTEILTESKTFTAYHGSPNNFEKFDLNKVGGGNDQNGPGFYFTLDRVEAEHYGEYVKKYQLTINKMPAIKGRINTNQILKLMKMAPDFNETILDWDENPNAGIRTYLTNMKDEESQWHALVSVWYDFYRYNPADWVKNMVKIGYDAIMLTGTQGYGNLGSKTHIIMYNVDNINEIKTDS